MSVAQLQELPNLADGYIGKIPVRNLWLLMLYASEFKSIGVDHKKLEDNLDDLPDLIAELLAHAVEKRQRRQLSFGYQSRKDVLSRVRGRIDVLSTERHLLLSRGLVACRFDELTVDTPRNRYVRGALETISRIVRSRTLAHRCRSIANGMKAMGVTGVIPTRAEMSADRFGRHDTDDRFMVEAAKLAFNLALLTEDSGTHLLAVPDRDEYWVRKLFEKAVGGFYNVTLSHQGWNIQCGNTMQWPIKQKSQGIDKILPNMKTDVVLNHAPSNRRIVIDTKFTSLLTSGWYRDESLRSGYLYQIYAYLRSQEGRGDVMADHASGLLLHPSVGDMIDESVVMQGHLIRFATVDLTASAVNIRARLLALAEQ